MGEDLQILEVSRQRVRIRELDRMFEEGLDWDPDYAIQLFRYSRDGDEDEVGVEVEANCGLPGVGLLCCLSDSR